MYCYVQGIANIEGTRTYEIKHNYKNKMRIPYVVHNKESFEYQCPCHFFNLDGISCAHMLLVFTSNLLIEIPPAYIINV